MPPMPAISGRQLVRALEKIGFTVARVRGSHHVMAHHDGRRVTVPVHQGRDIRPGTLRSILADANLGTEELTKLL